MDNFTQIFNLILKTNTFNFLLFMAILIFIAKKADVSKMLANMKNKVIEAIENSQKAKQDALKSLDNANIEYSKIPSELQTITANAENKLKSLTKGVIEDTEVKINAINTNARNIVEAESKQLKTNLTSILGQKAVETAKEYVIAELNYNPKLHDKFIEEAINELDEVTL